MQGKKVRIGSLHALVSPHHRELWHRALRVASVRVGAGYVTQSEPTPGTSSEGEKTMEELARDRQPRVSDADLGCTDFLLGSFPLLRRLMTRRPP